jgi:hypothetical protein
VNAGVEELDTSDAEADIAIWLDFKLLSDSCWSMRYFAVL